ncbi:MAG: hypothetical protein J6B23_09050 [Clostridia bacterium]|nr:hypothetical protein [Clostridia bacterium]
MKKGLSLIVVMTILASMLSIGTFTASAAETVLFSGLPSTSLQKSENGVTLEFVGIGDGASPQNTSGKVSISNSGDASNWTRLYLYYPMSSETHDGFLTREITFTTPSSALSQVQIGAYRNSDSAWKYNPTVQNHIPAGKTVVLTQVYDIDTGKYKIYVDGIDTGVTGTANHYAETERCMFVDFRVGSGKGAVVVEDVKVTHSDSEPVVPFALRGTIYSGSKINEKQNTLQLTTLNWNPEDGTSSVTQVGDSIQIKSSAGGWGRVYLNPPSYTTTTTGYLKWEFDVITSASTPNRLGIATDGIATWNTKLFFTNELSNGSAHKIGYIYGVATKQWYITVDGVLVSGGTLTETDYVRQLFVEYQGSNADDVFTVNNVSLSYLNDKPEITLLPEMPANGATKNVNGVHFELGKLGDGVNTYSDGKVTMTNSGTTDGTNWTRIYMNYAANPSATSDYILREMTFTTPGTAMTQVMVGAKSGATWLYSPRIQSELKPNTTYRFSHVYHISTGEYKIYLNGMKKFSGTSSNATLAEDLFFIEFRIGSGEVVISDTVASISGSEPTVEFALRGTIYNGSTINEKQNDLQLTTLNWNPTGASSSVAQAGDAIQIKSSGGGWGRIYLDPPAHNQLKSGYLKWEFDVDTGANVPSKLTLATDGVKTWNTKTFIENTLFPDTNHKIAFIYDVVSDEWWITVDGAIAENNVLAGEDYVSRLFLECQGNNADDIFTVNNVSLQYITERPAMILVNSIPENGATKNINGVHFELGKLGDGANTYSDGKVTMTNSGTSDGANWTRIYMNYPVAPSAASDYIVREFTFTTPGAAMPRMLVGAKSGANWLYSVEIQHLLDPNSTYRLSHVYHISTGEYKIYLNGVERLSGTSSFPTLTEDLFFAEFRIGNGAVVISDVKVTRTPVAPEYSFSFSGTVFDGATLNAKQNGARLFGEKLGDGTYAQNVNGGIDLTSTGEKTGANWSRIYVNYPVKPAEKSGYIYLEYDITTPSAKPDRLIFGADSTATTSYDWTVSTEEVELEALTDYKVGFYYDIKSGRYYVTRDGLSVDTGLVKNGTENGIKQIFIEYRGGATGAVLKVNNVKLEYLTEERKFEGVCFAGNPTDGATKTENGVTFSITGSNIDVQTRDGYLGIEASAKGAKPEFRFTSDATSGIVKYSAKVMLYKKPISVGQPLDGTRTVSPDAIPYSTTNPKWYIIDSDKLSELKEQYNTLIEFIVDIDSGVAIFAVNGKPQYVTDGVDASNVDLGRFFVPELESGAILVVDNITYAHYTNGYDCTFVTMTEGSAETAIGVRKEKLSQPENAKAIMAAYVSETKLASADVAPFTLEPGKLCYAKAELASGVNTDGITLYKTMLWAGESSLKPIMAPYTIEK